MWIAEPREAEAEVRGQKLRKKQKELAITLFYENFFSSLKNKTKQYQGNKEEKNSDLNTGFEPRLFGSALVDLLLCASILKAYCGSVRP